LANDKTLKAAVVGLRSGHHRGFLGNLRNLEGVEIVAYCEEFATEKLDEMREQDPGATMYSSLDDLIEKEEFDLAQVVQWPSEVPETVRKLAEAGKHMLIDKQFARNSEDLKPAVKAVQDNGVTTFIGYPWRFHPAMVDLKGMIDDGTMGRPLSVECRQIYGQIRPGSKEATDEQYRNETAGGGALHYVGCHHLELMRFLMGCEVKSVQAMTGRPVGNIEEPLEDVAILAVEYENGGFGSLHTGYLIHHSIIPPGASTYDSTLAFRGLDGWAHWPRVGEPTLHARSVSPKWAGANTKTIEYEIVQHPGYGSGAWYHNEIQRFVEDIRARRPGVLNLTDGLYVLQSIDAAYESARTGRRVEVEYGL
jgi:predicted dehydrogenase